MRFPIRIFRPKYVDHLQRWSRIFRSEESETNLSIWILAQISEIFGKMESTQRVYPEPIQPLNPTVYVKAISFSGLCASSIGSKFDQTRVRRLSSPKRNPEPSFSFSLRYSAGAYRRKSQHFKTSLNNALLLHWNLDLTKSLGTGQICSLNGGFVISKTSIKWI